MRNKASFVLLEQLVMILVVSLAAAACLRIFAWSDRTSREMQQRSEAVILCQNGAETIKAAGNMEDAMEMIGAQQQGELWALHSGDIRLEIRELPNALPGLGQAELCAFGGNGEEILFALVVGWQEVAP